MQLFLIKSFYHFDFMKLQMVSFHYQQKKVNGASNGHTMLIQIKLVRN